jgi:FKBP-type peptidyl-prolyl cis-trans isomerase 2
MDTKQYIPVLVVGIIIIVILLGVYVVFFSQKTIDVGDCADIHYTARYAVNGTIFDSSEGEIYKVFVNPNLDLTIPHGYEGYSAAMPYGFLNSLIGLTEGHNITVTVPPEQTYGVWNETALSELFNLSYGIPYFPRITAEHSYPTTENLTKSALQTAFEQESAFSVDIDSLQVGDHITFHEGTLPNGTAVTWDIEITNLTEDRVHIRHHVVNNTILPPIDGIRLWNTSIIIYNESVFYERADPDLGMVISNAEGIMGQPIHMKIIEITDEGIYLAMNTEAPVASLVGQDIIYEFKILKVYDTAPQDN